MNRIALLISVLIVVLTLAGCGSDGGSAPSPATPSLYPRTWYLTRTGGTFACSTVVQVSEFSWKATVGPYPEMLWTRGSTADYDRPTMTAGPSAGMVVFLVPMHLTVVVPEPADGDLRPTAVRWDGEAGSAFAGQFFTGTMSLTAPAPAGAG